MTKTIGFVGRHIDPITWEINKFVKRTGFEIVGTEMVVLGKEIHALVCYEDMTDWAAYAKARKWVKSETK